MSDTTVRVAQPNGRTRSRQPRGGCQPRRGGRPHRRRVEMGWSASDTRREIEQPPCQRKPSVSGLLTRRSSSTAVKGADGVTAFDSTPPVRQILDETAYLSESAN